MTERDWNNPPFELDDLFDEGKLILNEDEDWYGDTDLLDYETMDDTP